MRKNILTGLATLVIASAGISGCNNYLISQEGVDQIVETSVKDWVNYTDNAMTVHQFIQEGKYVEAQSFLKNYLKQQSKDGSKCEGFLKTTNKVSKPAVERITNIIDQQIEKIDECLD